MQEYSIVVNGNLLTGLQWGDPSKPVLLAIHGWLDNAASFIPLADILFNQSAASSLPFQLIAIDLPGHGGSYHKSGHYNFIEWVEDIYQLINSGQWLAVSLLGHSMGAMISSVFAATFPELIDKLILIEGLGAISAQPAQTITQLRTGITSRHNYYLKSINNSRSNRLTSLDAAVEARCRVSDMLSDNARMICQRNLTAEHDGYYWRSDAKLRTRSLMRYDCPQVEYVLSNISVDCVIIKGEKGYPLLTHSEFLERYAETHFKVKTVVGGHHVHMDTPVQVAAIISAFLLD